MEGVRRGVHRLTRAERRGNGAATLTRPDEGGATRRPDARAAADPVVGHVRTLIERGALRPGDRLPAERDLALGLGLSRPTVRSGLKALAAMGVVVSRRGAGTFVAAGPPDLGKGPLGLLAALYGFTPDEMFEARLVLEVGAAGLAAEHAQPEHTAVMAEEVTEMFATLSDPHAFLVHDVRFHQALGAGCGNRVLAALVEMVSAQFYEQRRRTVKRAGDLRESAEMHRRIYRAVRSRDPRGAREAMDLHLRQARHAQARETAPSRDRVVAGDEPSGRRRLER